MHDSIDPDRIDWGCNTGKREADITMYRAMAYDLLMIGASKKHISVLSFPGPDWLWEKGLCDAFNRRSFKFTGIEREPKIWRKLEQGAAVSPEKFKMHDKPCSFVEFANTRNARNKPFDLVYLDWMGTWSNDKKQDLEQLLAKKMLAPGGLLAMTLSLRRGNPRTNEELHDLSHDLPLAFYDARGRDKYVSNIKVRGIPHWVQQRANEEYGVELRPLLASVYYSVTGLSDQVQPQLQLLFLREK
jgi:hypothetical protein